jgi:hypothetical protein
MPSHIAALSHASVLVATCVALSSCGDDTAKSDDGPADDSACLQAGYTDVECVCPGGGVGWRSCTEELVWTECSCRPPRDTTVCQRENQAVLCNPCPGQSEGFETRCTVELTFDCSCPGDDDDDDPGSVSDDAGVEDDAG